MVICSRSLPLSKVEEEPKPELGAPGSHLASEGSAKPHTICPPSACTHTHTHKIFLCGWAATGVQLNSYPTPSWGEMRSSFPITLQLEYSTSILPPCCYWDGPFHFFFSFFEILKHQISLRDTHAPFPGNHEMFGVGKK